MQSVINLSILIPTYKRLDLLQECLHSITQQNVLPKEVLIGNDDNNNFISEEKLRNLFNLPISVINRNISLGQAKNVDDLIQRANSQWLMIIHDDDLLISNSLEKFFSYIDKDNENNVYFGMQKLLEKNRLHTDHEGIDFNNKFHRNINLNNSSSFDIVSNQSLPSNGFIINTNRAKQIGYTYHIE
ncbi:MAG TPA: glycosyltransferase family 2 protein, partial [Ferrovaceae bacterium]|nr:glycosyltransferase family 2 protein [Ferrovaceae bacterium]